jgi:hypothetical protein
MLIPASLVREGDRLGLGKTERSTTMATGVSFATPLLSTLVFNTMLKTPL